MRKKSDLRMFTFFDGRNVSIHGRGLIFQCVLSALAYPYLSLSHACCLICNLVTLTWVTSRILYFCLNT